MDDVGQLAEGSVRVRRPSLKKRLAEASDEDEAPRRPKKAKSRKRVKTESTEVTPTPTPDEEHVDVDGDVDMDTPVDVEGGTSSYKDTLSEPSPPPQPSRSSKKARPDAQSKTAAIVKRIGKRRQMVLSDDGEDEDDEPPSPAGYISQNKPYMDDEDNEDDFEPATRSSLASKKSSTAAAKNGKGLVSVKGAKRKNTKDDKPIMMKDESKPRIPTTTPIIDDGASKDVALFTPPTTAKPEGDSADAVNTPTEEVKVAPLAPPKRKLPTIKKNKPVGSAPSTGTTTPTTIAKPPIPVPPKPAPPAAISIPANRKATGPPTANKELDLFNSGVYAELFGKAGATAPRTGVNQREKDDRRKELDRMRDAARAAREADAKNSFDLQAHSEKVARFEERLRQGRTRAYLPNFIAGALQDRYDREQRALSGR